MTFCGGPTDESSRYVATVSGTRPLTYLRTSLPSNTLFPLNRRQNAHGLGPPPGRRHPLRAAVRLTLQRRQLLARLELAPTANRIRDLVPSRTQRRLRTRLDDQRPPRRRRARLTRAHRLALRPLTRTRRRMAPPTRPRARRAARHRGCGWCVPRLCCMAARQSRHVRLIILSPSMPP